ncbi:hypothetical protein JZ751_019168 [Albula glossodonta]|uniref:BTB domain-containing protein n=1 Tax=Albula glossodonta TaxID=121402 RepID=A0A8T2MSQ6_9TELE|nr:hypothetical protein JZ751_019168 [Albula glossodonta]
MTLVQRMEALLVQGNGSDLVLRVHSGPDQVKVIQAHSLVLSLHSPVFQELLQNGSAPNSTGSSTTLLLTETPDCAALFHKFIRYLYCGEISVRLDQAVPLHKLASRYGVQGLQQGVSLYMQKHLASDSPSGHAVSWYHYATQAGDTDLQHSCLHFLSWNLSAVLQSREWPAVSIPLLMDLLQRSDLVLHSELELFQALEVWIQRNQPDGLAAENALRAVRYAMIPPQTLFRLQRQSPTLSRYHQSVRDLLYMSYQFHSASPLQLAKYFNINCSLFTPRNYLSPGWGSPWVIPNPTRDDRSASFHTQLGPSGHDAGKRVGWNALFSPRWLPLGSAVPGGRGQGAGPEVAAGAGHPRVIVTPASSGADMAGVSFQKTVLVMARQQSAVVVRHVFNFHQSTEETGHFLSHADLQRRASEYLIDGSLHLHVIIKPLYHSLILATK